MDPRRPVARLVLVLAAGGAAAADTVELDTDRPPAQARPSAVEAAEALARARTHARLRHDAALRACTRAPQPGTCVREAQEAYVGELRAHQAASAGLATPPPPGVHTAPATQGDSLIRDLEQTRPQPRPAPSPVPSGPGMGRPFGR